MQDISLPSIKKFGMKKDVQVNTERCEAAESMSGMQKSRLSDTIQRGVTRCYNCGILGHISSQCTKPKKPKGSCYSCGSMEHRIKECPDKKTKERSSSEQVANITENSKEADDFCRIIKYQAIYKDCKLNFEFETQLDSGSPISFIKESLIPNIVVKKINEMNHDYIGVNESKLQITGMVRMNVTMGDVTKNNIKIYIVSDKTMRSPAILGRDVMQEFNIKLIEPKGMINKSDPIYEIMNINIDCSRKDKVIDALNINCEIPYDKQVAFRDIFETKYLTVEKPNEPKIKMNMTLTLKEHEPFHFNPRRLAYAEKIQLQEILNRLLEKKIIRISESEYASPIVLVQKRNGEARLCVDYRVLNKYIARDNYPLPAIDDHISALHGKKYYSSLDLKDGFHQVKVDESAIKYTAFITPIGQYEYLGMPFGLKIATARFSRFINAVLEELIKAGHVIVYVDDFLVATKTIEEHLEVLIRVFELLVENCLELRLDKCRFLATKIDYLGYTIEGNSITPLDSGIAAVKNYPVPQNKKDLQSFIGLASYFRKFIEKFALIAAPLYKLLKQNEKFEFSKNELNAFETLKTKLIAKPVLSIYSPHDETEVHTDASSVGFGAVLLQKKNDKKFHPIFYFSKRTTETESKYHSFELETLAIIYALKRFRIYLYGIKFKIITDCNALNLTLKKRNVNARIERWAIELLSYDYELEHRPGVRMKHVDAFSRMQNVLVIEANSLEFNLAVSQGKYKKILELRNKLEQSEDTNYELRSGIVYRKTGNKLKFYVPENMEYQVINKYHDQLGHVGVEKTCEALCQNYYFPHLTKKVKEYVMNCLTCIAYTPKSGKSQGKLHNIPKGDEPFITLHIDHYGPIDKAHLLKKHILVIVDGFTKFVKLYATKSTTSKEAIDCLNRYFSDYSRPKTIVSDRGTCFTSAEFENFMREQNIIHFLIATATPKANGQAERINRVLGPMLAKLTDNEIGKYWYKILNEVEFALNNTINKSTGETPSKLLFGVNQRGKSIDGIVENLNQDMNVEERDLETIRTKAAKKIEKTQMYNKKYYDEHHKVAHEYKVGDYVAIRNFENRLNVSKKLIPYMKGPYEVVRVLKNDRYVLRSLDEYDAENRPYVGTWSAENMRMWKNENVNID